MKIKLEEKKRGGGWRSNTDKTKKSLNEEEEKEERKKNIVEVKWLCVDNFYMIKKIYYKITLIFYIARLYQN